MKPALVNVKSFIYWWNSTYPIDRWWREKYKVSFNSEAHRAMNFIDMKLEFEEDLMYAELRKEKREEQIYRPGHGDWLKKRKALKMSNREVDDLFDNFDIGNVQRADNGDIMI
jgi:hypothetical protein